LKKSLLDDNLMENELREIYK